MNSSAVYNAVAETMKTLPVIVRTLDIGGDKPVAYIQMKPELNPFLGERGIRLCLNRPELIPRTIARHFARRAFWKFEDHVPDGQ